MSGLEDFIRSTIPQDEEQVLFRTQNGLRGFPCSHCGPHRISFFWLPFRSLQYSEEVKPNRGTTVETGCLFSSLVLGLLDFSSGLLMLLASLLQNSYGAPHEAYLQAVPDLVRSYQRRMLSNASRPSNLGLSSRSCPPREKEALNSTASTEVFGSG